MSSALMAPVNDVFREVFNDASLQIREETNASHIRGWDSFAQVTLVVALEEKFGVSFTTKEISAMTCVGDLLKVLEQKVRR